MNLLSKFKVSAIKLADALNAAHDPFQEFTRPAMTVDQLSLAEKAQRLEDDLLSAFMIRGGTIINYRIPLDPRLPLDLGDQALWHGIYTAMFALKYRVTQDPKVCTILSALVQGLADQQPDGRLIRGIDDSGRIQADASNDQASGHLLGLYFAWLFGEPDTAKKAVELMDEWANRILVEGGRMKNPDGSTTTYGQLINGWKTDPLRLTLCLAIYGAAFQMTGSFRYLQAYSELMHTYGDLALYPKVRLLWLDTVYDTHRAAMHLAVLQNISIDFPGMAAVQRLRKQVSKQGNIWVNALCALADKRADDDTAIAEKVLSEFSAAPPFYNSGVDLTGSVLVSACGGQMLWNDDWVSRQPVPRWAMANEDFSWQRNLYSIAFRKQSDPPDSRYNGGAFLAAYWLCRLMKIL